MHSFLSVARELATGAAARIMDLQRAGLTRERKADHSLVTNADLASDKIIREGLKKAFPGHAVLTEENGLEGSLDAEFIWLIDPIDGTRAFAKGVAGFSVMVGLLRKGKPYLGVVVDPPRGIVYEALKGEGAYCNGIRVHVSNRRNFANMPIITSTGFPEPVKEALSHELSGHWLKPINSVGIKVGYLVRQEADIYINHHHFHYWDSLGPLVILEEAGGKMTYLDGTSLEYRLEEGTYRHKGPTLATNGILHPKVLNVLQTSKPRLD